MAGDDNSTLNKMKIMPQQTWIDRRRVVYVHNTDKTHLSLYAAILQDSWYTRQDLPPDFPKNTGYRWALKSAKSSIETYLDKLRICPSKIMPPRVGMLLGAFLTQQFSRIRAVSWYHAAGHLTSF